MTRNQFVFALSILTLCLFQPVLAQTAPEENKIVGKVPLRNFEGAWPEAQVREWAKGPVKEWLDKTALFFSMIKPENWADSRAAGERYVEAARLEFESSQGLLSSGQTGRSILLSRPYDLTATFGIYWSVGLSEELSELGHLSEKSGFTGGPSPELALELINHGTEGRNLLTKFTVHVIALLRWHDEAVAAPRW